MQKGQKVIVWVVGILAACVLFYVGIGKLYIAEHGLDLPGVIVVEPIHRPTPPFGFAAFEQPVADRYQAEMDRYEQTIARDYYVGALAPILILGGCAFLSTLKPKGD